MPLHYEIKIKGALDENLAAWFDGLTITHDPAGDTHLAGAVRDQTALYGLIAKAHDLHSTVIAVEQRTTAMTPNPTAPPTSANNRRHNRNDAQRRTTMTILVITLFLAVVGAFVIRASAPLGKVQGRLVARDRSALITGFVMALTAFAILTLPLEELVIPATVWLVGVGLLAGGVVGAALRWPYLPWYAGARPRRRAIGVSVTLCICALLMSVAVT